ncbi:MAG: FAD-dependent monooxygenase [Acidobacteriota bacterium]
MSDLDHKATPWDVVVVGGGPAGLAAALALRITGASVLVLERRQPPLDKTCGEGLMPDAVASLRALGVNTSEIPAHSFTGIRYLDGELEAAADFPRGVGLGVRRLELSQALLSAAHGAGVELRFGARVEGLLPPEPDAAGKSRWPGLLTAEGEIRASLLVAADGLRSPLRHAAGLASDSSPLRRFGMRRHFRIQPWSPRVDVHWGQDCEAYVTPVAEDEVGVAFLWSGFKATFEELLQGFPRLEQRLAGQTPSSQTAGCGPLAQGVRKPWRRNLALIGDASGYVDAITGEGLAMTFAQAEALGQCFEGTRWPSAASGSSSHSSFTSSLARYGRRHRAIGRLPNAMTRGILALERRPELRRRVLTALHRDPDLFQRLLGIHARTLPVHRLGWKGVYRLARSVVYH